MTTKFEPVEFKSGDYNVFILAKMNNIADTDKCEQILSYMSRP